MTDLIDAQTVRTRLEEAGRTLLILPPGRTHGLQLSQIAQVITDEAAKEERRPLRLCADPASVTRMDQAFTWLSLIPQDRYVLRRIVGARSLVSPLTERHLFSWRRLATLLGADHKAIQRWHRQGIDLIVEALQQRAAA